MPQINPAFPTSSCSGVAACGASAWNTPPSRVLMWVPRGPRRTAPHGGSLGISRGGVPHRAWKGISIPCLPPSRLGESTSLGGERSGSGEGGPPACGSKAGPHERGTEWDRRPVQGSISRSLHTGRALAPGVWGPEDSTPGPRQTQEHLAGQQELGGHVSKTSAPRACGRSTWGAPPWEAWDRGGRAHFPLGKCLVVCWVPGSVGPGQLAVSLRGPL